MLPELPAPDTFRQNYSQIDLLQIANAFSDYIIRKFATGLTYLLLTYLHTYWFPPQ